jgi:hypothetical protein
LILHHPGTVALAIEIAVVGVLVVALGLVWFTGRRRQANRRRAVARMRDDADQS